MNGKGSGGERDEDGALPIIISSLGKNALAWGARDKQCVSASHFVFAGWWHRLEHIAAALPLGSG